MKRLFLSLTALFLAGCSSSEAAPRFGEFGHDGTFLVCFGVDRITLAEARSLLPSSQAPSFRAYSPDNGHIASVLDRFASLSCQISYYVEGEEGQQVRQELFQGGDFRYLLQNNVYMPFGQMSVDFLLMDREILDSLEKENEDFAAKGEAVPFKEPYTYHRSSSGNLVLQTHRYAELPASLGGGIGATFREDCEMLYDAEGKLDAWHASLGLFTSTPSGISKQGYIFEAAFVWNLK